MLTGFEERLQPELIIVDSLVQKEFALHAGHVTKFISYDTKRSILPTLVLSFTKMFGDPKEKIYAISAVFEFIHIANIVHQEDRESIPYEVLIGDYFFSKFFAYLCKYDLLEWLPVLANLICERQEAYVLKIEKTSHGNNHEKLLELVDKEKAKIYAESCFAGAKLGGANKNEIALAKKFGLNYGRAVGLLEYAEGLELASQSLSLAKDALYLLPWNENKDALLESTKTLELKLISSQVHKAV